ncbi:hypothetical protein HPB50_025128 [Hyalomma asiaticum]|uniref:Uncharacterized protein n=1 Tax=Hyalomma asiaticum TaxID=266040 RepID=A0ACB7RTT7_HYAAI|nr:hypothetical protein HPB50_025128 [Hyalomma asiaticum]
MWLQYLASGNWLNAYVAMEESLRTSRLQDTDRYAVYAPAFVRLKQRACVEDFLGEPCPVQPLDCLMAALFVRAYLPRDVLSRREPVTWERALQYLPHFLASRLSEEALAYLCAYPVFLGENGSQCTTECTSAASAQPCLNPELYSASEETPSRTRCEAHEGMKTEPGTSNASLEEKATPSPESGKEYPSVASESSSILPWLTSYLSKCPKEPTPSDALFQESARKANVELKRDDDPINEDADKTVYLDVPPGPSLRPRNSPDGIADTHTLRKQDMLFAAIQGLARRQHDPLRNAYVYSTLDEVNKTPASRNTAADSCQHIEELQGALSRMSIAPSSTESTPAGGVANLQPERAGNL